MQGVHNPLLVYKNKQDDTTMSKQLNDAGYQCHGSARVNAPTKIPISPRIVPNSQARWLYASVVSTGSSGQKWRTKGSGSAWKRQQRQSLVLRESTPQVEAKLCLGWPYVSVDSCTALESPWTTVGRVTRN
jgi:hypothetical protein